MRYADPLYAEEEKIVDASNKIAQMGDTTMSIISSTEVNEDNVVMEDITGYSDDIAIQPDSAVDVKVSAISGQPEQQTQTVTQPDSGTLNDLLAALSALRTRLQTDLDKL